MHAFIGILLVDTTNNICLWCTVLVDNKNPMVYSLGGHHKRMQISSLNRYGVHGASVVEL